MKFCKFSIQCDICNIWGTNMSCTLLVINTYGYICMHTNEKAHLHKMCIHSANMQCEQLDLNKLIK